MEPIQEVNRERLGSTLVSSVVHRRATPGAGMFSGCGKTEIDKSNPRCSCCKARALATLPLYCPTDINVNKVIVHRKLDVLSLMFHIHFTNPMKFPYAQIPLPGIVSLASTPVFLPVIKPVIQPWSHILLYSFCQSEEYKESVKSV